MLGTKEVISLLLLGLLQTSQSRKKIKTVNYSLLFITILPIISIEEVR